MALTPEQRKKLLGFGGLRRVAKSLGFSQPYVTQINSLLRPDPSGRVRDEITRLIRANLEQQNLPLLEHEDIWPAPARDHAVAAIVAGAKGR